MSFDSRPSRTGGGGWWAWDVTELYQHYLDQSDTWEPHWPNYGVALTASNPKTFYAIDATLANSDPTLYVTYNGLPNAPLLDSPPTGYISESEAMTLSVWKLPADPNGDDVMVSFQISDDGVHWDSTHLVFQSPFDDRRASPSRRRAPGRSDY